MDGIELSDFVANTLVEIAKGVKKANETLRPGKSDGVFELRFNKGGNKDVPGIRFDLAVTAAQEQADKAGFFVAMVGLGGGANAEKSRAAETVQRITFEVGLSDNWP